MDGTRFMNFCCHKFLNSFQKCPARPACELLLIVLGLHLLRRSLHDVVTNRTLHAVLEWIVVNGRKLPGKIVPGWRRRCAPLQRSGFPRVIGRRLAPEPAVNQVVEKNKLGHTGNQSSDGDPPMYWDKRL